MMFSWRDILLFGTEQRDSTYLLTKPGMTLAFNIAGFDGVQSYMVRMVATDYDRFAVIFLETIYKSRIYIEIILLGRSPPHPLTNLALSNL